MAVFALTPDQKETLSKQAEEFRSWLNTGKGRNAITEHREHEKYLKEKLSSENLNKMTESQFSELYKKLWASNMWRNKDWYIENRLIYPNGLVKIKTELEKLLYSSDDLVHKYDNFRSNITGFGTSLISEILHFVFPDKFCLWNEKPKTVLPFLRLNILPEKFFRHQINTGEEYYQCIQALSFIKDELTKFGIRDFIDLDIYLWRIFDDIIPKELQLPEPNQDAIQLPRTIIESHESAEYYLLELGRILGYIPYTVDQSKTFNGQKLGDVAVLKEIPAFAGARDLISVREIDIIWFGDDENPKLCFEVEHTTDIVHGLNRLLQLQHLYAKFFIVANEDRRPKFKIEMQKYPFRSMKDRFGFISYDELTALYKAAMPFYELKTRLLKEK
jgi:hypothetical protein